jgi:hypothetical protein
MPYDNGEFVLSQDGGESWISYEDWIGLEADMFFEVWAEDVFSPPYDIVTYKRLVAAAKNSFFYESL